MSQSAAEKVRLKLEQDILAFKIQPGERLDETRLAQVHDVSRTPVREALRQLSATGLVEMRPHRGTIVKRLSLSEVVEMFEMLAVMDGVCARFAAKRGMHESIRDIRAAYEASAAFTEIEAVDQYYAENQRFHEAIYKACGNSAMARQTQHLRERLKPFHRYQFNRTARLKQSFEEHGRIVLAIEAGDAAEADRLMQEHVSVQSTFIANLVQSMPKGYLDEPSAHHSFAPPRRSGEVFSDRMPSIQSLHAANGK